VKLPLTHVPQARQQYYGARALARLQELVEVVLHDGEAPLEPAGVVAAARDVDFIVADRATPKVPPGAAICRTGRGALDKPEDQPISAAWPRSGT